MNDLVCIKAFLTHHEAGIAKGLLENQQIESIISADDCGGWRPELTIGRGGIRLLVKASDKQKALEIIEVLDTTLDESNG